MVFDYTSELFIGLHFVNCSNSAHVLMVVFVLYSSLISLIAIICSDTYPCRIVLEDRAMLWLCWPVSTYWHCGFIPLVGAQ